MLKRLLPPLLLLLLSIPAQASTVIYADLDTLIRDADLVLHATVGEVTTRNLAKVGLPQIVTDVHFRVHRTMKGSNPGPEFSLRLMGGTWGDYKLDIPGMPVFTPDEEVVLFLEWTGKNYTVMGLSQGKYRVATDDQGRKTASRSLVGLGVVTKQPGSDGRVSQFVEAEPPVPLAALLQRINEQAPEQAK